MKTVYLDPSGSVIDEPGYVPPPDASLYRTRRGTFVFPAVPSLHTLTSEKTHHPQTYFSSKGDLLK